MTAAEVAQLLNGVKRERDGYVGLCPVHNDHSPSLRLADGRNGGVILKCRANCETADVVRALGLSMRDLAPADLTVGSPATEVAYPYTDEHGHLLFETVRSIDLETGKKRFRQRRPDGKGGTAYNLEGVRRVLYRLPELFEAIALAKRIYVCEGEKDCDRLAALGLAATTSPMGAGKWRSEHAAYLEGATDVVVLADNDQPGREHAKQVAATIPGARVVEFPELPEKGDVSDWLDQGHTVAELARRADPVRRITLIDRSVACELGEANSRPIDAVPTHLYSWNDACLGFGGRVGLARGWHVVLAAPSNKGKSMMALNCALAGLEAGRSVAYILLEGSQRDLLSRLYPLASGINSRHLQPGQHYDAVQFAKATEAFHALLETHRSRFFVADRADRSVDGVVAAIHDAAGEGCTEVIIDYVQLVRVAGSPGVYETTLRVSGAICEAATSLGVVTLGISQFNRPAVNTREGGGLTIHGLSGGGPWENDADQVVILDTAKAKREGLTMASEVKLAKNRHGPAIDIPVTWDFRTFRVSEPPVREFGKIAV